MAMSLNSKTNVDELTKCSVCTGDLVIPKSLPCLHTFCLQCIKDHCRNDSPGDQVHCPVCRSSFVIPVGGVEQLPSNFFLKGLTDAKNVSNEPDKIMPCLGCSDHSEETDSSVTPATMICTGCGQHLCAQCSKPHRRFPGGGHEVVDFGIELKKEVMMSQGSFCRQHPSNRLEIYCIECNVNLCVVCCHGDKQKEHYPKVRPITDVYKDYRDTIERDVQLVLEREKSVQQEAAILKSEQKKANDEIAAIETDLSHIAGEIRRRLDEAVSQLTARLSKDKSDVSTVANDRYSQFELELAVFRGFTRYSSELVKRGKPCDVTHAYVELHSRAEKLLQQEVKKHEYQLPARTVSSRDLFDKIFDYVSTHSTKYKEQELRVASEVKKLNDEREKVKDQLKKLAAEHEAKLKQLERDRDYLKRERDNLKDQLSKLTADKKLLEKDKTDLQQKLVTTTGTISKLTADMEKDKHVVEQERHCVNNQLAKLRDEKVQLEKDKEVMKYDRDALKLQLSKFGDEKKQLEKDKEEIRRDRDTLKEQLSKLEEEKKQLEKEKADLTGKAETNVKQMKQLQDQLGVKMNTNYALVYSSPEKVKAIHTTDEAKPICGLTTLNNELYVFYEDNTDITVYDTETYSVQRSLHVPRLAGVSDMTSCKRHQCIYIADNDIKVVHRVDDKNTVTQWPVDDVPGGMSVNSACNVLVTFVYVRKVKEFTTDGKLLRTISLASSILNAWHTVELTTGQLVVCHGVGNDALHRVCIVDSSGRVLKSYGGSKGSGSGQLNVPIRLAAVNGGIFVADHGNHRVLLLSPTLSLIREVVSGLRDPLRMWFDDDSGRLNIGDNKLENSKWISGKCIVFSV